MEYRIEASVILEASHVAELIMAWYRGPTARPISTATVFRLHTGRVPGNSTSQRFGAFTSGANIRPGVLTGATASERASASIAQHHSCKDTVSTFPVATQPAIIQSETNFAIASGVRLRKMSGLGDFKLDYFFWQNNQVLILERLSGRHYWMRLKEGWDNPQVANPKPVSLGRFRLDGPMPVAVYQMTDAEKLAEAAQRAIPGITEQGGEAIQGYVESLLDPDTIAQMLALLAISVVFPIVGVGFAIAGAYYLGEDSVKVLENLVDFVKRAKAAQTEADLDKAADSLVISVITGGSVAWSLLLNKKKRNRQLIKADRNSGTKSTRATPQKTQEISKPIKQKKTSSITTPQLPGICASIQTATNGKTKKERYDARMNVIAAARKQPELTDVTDRFELNNRAIERARLSNNIYNLNKKKEYIEPKKEELRKKKLHREIMKEDPSLYLPEQFRIIDEDIAQLEKDTTKYPDEDVLTPPEGWEVMETSIPGEEPVYVVYKSTFEDPAKPVLVFRGTDNDVSAWKDWSTNIAQGAGIETEQYTGSIKKAQDMQEKYKKSGGFEIAGHSKAGGQAAAAGIISDAKTYTFNAAGVHHRTIERVIKDSKIADAQKISADGKPLVDAFNFPNEILSYLQDETSLPSPSAAGVRHIVPAQDINGNPVEIPLDRKKRTEYHGMPYLIDSMERQKQDDLQVLANQLGCN